MAGKNDKEKDSYESQSYTSHQKSGYGGLLKRNADIPVEKWPMLTVLRKTFRNGYLNTQGGWADSGRSIKYMIHLCREVGVVFKTGIPGTLCQLIRGKRNQVTGIEMKDGSKYFGKIIVAAGAWTPKLVPELSKCMTAVGQPVVHIKLTEESRKELDGSPVWAVLGETGFYGFPPTKEGIVKIARHSDGFTNIKRKETSNSLPNEDSESSTFNEPLPVPVSVPRTEVTNPEIGAQIPLEALFEFKAFIQKHFPIEFQSISSTRMCWYTDSQDGDFFMTRIPGQPDLFVATGGSGHAFKFLPVIGNVMVDVFKSLQTPATQRFAFRDIASSSKRESSRSGNGTLKNLDSVELASHSDLVASFKIPAKI